MAVLHLVLVLVEHREVVGVQGPGAHHGGHLDKQLQVVKNWHKDHFNECIWNISGFFFNYFKYFVPFGWLFIITLEASSVVKIKWLHPMWNTVIPVIPYCKIQFLHHHNVHNIVTHEADLMVLHLNDRETFIILLISVFQLMTSSNQLETCCMSKSFTMVTTHCCKPREGHWWCHRQL